MTAAGGELAEAAPAPPVRLGVGDLLWWMFASALILAQYRYTADPRAEPGIAETLYWTIAAADALIYGPALASLAIVWRARRRGLAYPCHPGHWLLAVKGAAAALSMVAHLTPLWLADVVPGLGQPVRVWLWVGLTLASHLAVAALAFRAAQRQPPNGFWGFVFAVTIAHSAMQFLLLATTGPASYPAGSIFRALSSNLYLLASLAGATALVLAVVVDQSPRTRPRDFLHWVGVAVSLGGNFLVWLWYYRQIALLNV